MARDQAYGIVQAAARRAWEEGAPLRDLLAGDPATAGLDLDTLFDEGWYVRHADALLARLDGIA
jgi:adenylosuccinate lyase